GQVATRFTTRFDWALVLDTNGARAAAAFVNERTSGDELVLLSPHVAWLYRARSADFLQAVAATGEPIAFYPPGMSRSRFAFDPTPGTARFVVVDAFWRRWAEASPPLARLTRLVESWPEELRVGEISVRRNPAQP
ncbi:MAG TPA: hypothetical protein VFX49_23705, partial [Chloroflexota bacterium]|nr:hypothetical protein [Chloroflexota bacterium]